MNGTAIRLLTNVCNYATRLVQSIPTNYIQKSHWMSMSFQGDPCTSISIDIPGHASAGALVPTPAPRALAHDRSRSLRRRPSCGHRNYLMGPPTQPISFKDGRRYNSCPQVRHHGTERVRLAASGPPTKNETWQICIVCLNAC